jgi:hypothetical protein
MIIKEIQCYECAYCGHKYANEEDCARCEAKHENTFIAEEGRFDTFKTEIDKIESKKHVRPINIIEVDTGNVDQNDDPIMETQEVPGDLQILHCSKCLKQIHENSIYVEAFGYYLCLECAVPLFRIFSRNYMTFRTQFGNQVNLHSHHHDVIDDDMRTVHEIHDHECDDHIHHHH